MNNEISPLVLPVLTGLIAFAIVGRVLTLYQQPEKKTRWDYYFLAEYISGLFICLTLVFNLPLPFRYSAYACLLISFCAANWNEWSSLITEANREADEPQPIARITIERKTLGDIIREKQKVTLAGQAHPDEDHKTLAEKTEEDPPVAAEIVGGEPKQTEKEPESDAARPAA